MKKFLIFLRYIKVNWMTILVSLVIGMSVGLFIYKPKMTALQSLEAKPQRIPDPTRPLINPLLGYDNAEATNFGQLVSFKGKLSNLVDKEVNENNASKISVYFRDLNIGRWISINDNESYSPASLLKVPIMIAYYHLSETNPALFNRKIKFNIKDDVDNEQSIIPSQKLEVGKTYTVEELINEMIIYSDNDSMELLNNNFDSKILNKVFSDMDIFLPTFGGAQDFISVKNYALLFRVLYGSTYLSASNSEKILELLSKSKFQDGLVSGVPKDTVVAHKFGERYFIDTGSSVVTSREFHDCGIIYYSKAPYLLCVMTKGNDLNKLEKTVNDISKLVYSEVQNKDN